MVNQKIFSDLKIYVDSIPVIDVHSHINGKHPAARDPKEIIFYHYIVTEMLSAGAPPEIFSKDIPFEDALRRAIPYLKLIRNTATYWCLTRILRDLYGFKEDEINEDNWKELVDRIYSKIEEKDWYKIILEKTRLKKGFLTFRFGEEIPEYDKTFYVGALRIEPLITRLSHEDIQALEKATGISINSLSRFEEALSVLFKKFSECIAVTASFLPEETFEEPDKAKARGSFQKRLSGSRLDSSEMKNLRSYSMNCVLSLAEEYDWPFQIMLGVVRPVPGASPPDYAIVSYNAESLPSLCRLFHKFSSVKFDVFLANRIQSHELTVIAKNYPNVYVAGYWWYVFYPTIIDQFILERLQILPRNKINGFFSDAYVAEWTYAKACLVRRQLALTLAKMVEEEYYTMDLAKDIAADMLSRNPERLYKLEQA